LENLPFSYAYMPRIFLTAFLKKSFFIKLGSVQVWIRIHNLSQLKTSFSLAIICVVLPLPGAVVGIDDEDDSTFTVTVDNKTFHFQVGSDGVHPQNVRFQNV
jgi:hypothetical protein